MVLIRQSIHQQTQSPAVHRCQYFALINFKLMSRRSTVCATVNRPVVDRSVMVHTNNSGFKMLLLTTDAVLLLLLLLLL